MFIGTALQGLMTTLPFTDAVNALCALRFGYVSSAYRLKFVIKLGAILVHRVELDV